MNTAEDVCGEQLCCENAGRMVNILANQLKHHFLVPEDDKGLTMLQRHMLHFIILASMHREIYQKDVEAEFRIRKSTATGMLQLLEKKGFIRRESVERDARLKKVVPTGKALALREGVLEDIRNVEKKMIEGIVPEELEICIRVLNQMSRNLSCREQDCREREMRSGECIQKNGSCKQTDNK